MTFHETAFHPVQTGDAPRSYVHDLIREEYLQEQIAKYSASGKYSDWLIADAYIEASNNLYMTDAPYAIHA